MSSETSCGGASKIHAYGLSHSSLGIQLSFHILVDIPSPMRRIRPSFNISRPSHKDRQICDGLLPRAADKMSVWGKYTAFKTRALRESGSFKILHTWRANRAKLKISMSRKPRPPLYFGMVKVSQETRDVNGSDRIGFCRYHILYHIFLSNSDRTG